MCKIQFKNEPWLKTQILRKILHKGLAMEKEVIYQCFPLKLKSQGRDRLRKIDFLLIWRMFLFSEDIMNQLIPNSVWAELKKWKVYKVLPYLPLWQLFFFQRATSLSPVNKSSWWMGLRACCWDIWSLRSTIYCWFFGGVVPIFVFILLIITHTCCLHVG